MDLARHMETVDTIKRHADTAAHHGFNALVLYLEGRVRTDSFPYREAGASYSIEDMAAVVAHATELGMDVIPVIATLGHCGQFLACPALRHLGESRNGRARFGDPADGGSVLCPSLDETYVFLDTYLRELTQAFTGRNVHVGLDEAWDLGYCPLCQQRWEHEGLASLFLGHLTRMRAILQRLGRRLWMWDDFIEFFPEHTHRIPKDTVLCHWSYDNAIENEGIQAHFTNRRRRDWLAIYERLGLDVVICPWDRHPRNIETFTDYARRRRVYGGLLTEWEGSPRYWPGQTTVVAFTGALWRAKRYDTESAWNTALRQTLPGTSRTLQATAREWIRSGGSPPAVSLTVFHGERNAADASAQHALALITGHVLNQEMPFLPPAALKLAAQLSWSAERVRLLAELHDLIPAILHPRRPLSDVPLLRTRLRKWHKHYRALLKRLPAAFGHDPAAAHPDDDRITHAWKALPNTVASLGQALEREPSTQDWLLVLRLFLQDCHGAPRLRVIIFAAGRRHLVAQGCFKPASPVIAAQGGHYTIHIPLQCRNRPASVLVETWGYGGQGVAFLELQNPSETIYPVAIEDTTGPVKQPHALLKDDATVAVLGNTDVREQIHRPQLAEQIASVRLRLDRLTKEVRNANNR